MSPMKHEPVDMSPRAVALRLEEVRGLFRLTEYLAKFRAALEAAEQARKAGEQ